MAVTDAQVDDLRRMVNEPTDVVYSDAVITRIIEKYLVLDEQGEEPTILSSATPPVPELNPDWIASYDLNAAAGDIWEEKAGAVSHKFDFEADGGKYTRSQIYDQYMRNARYYRSKRMPSTLSLKKQPKEVDPQVWIGNLPEPD